MSTGTTAQALADQIAELMQKSENEINRLTDEVDKTDGVIAELEGKLAAAKAKREDLVAQKNLLSAAVSGSAHIDDGGEQENEGEPQVEDKPAADAAGDDSAKATGETEAKPAEGEPEPEPAPVEEKLQDKKPAARRKPAAKKEPEAADEPEQENMGETQPEPAKKPAASKPKATQPPFPDPWEDAGSTGGDGDGDDAAEDRNKVDMVFSNVSFDSGDEDDDDIL